MERHSKQSVPAPAPLSAGDPRPEPDRPILRIRGARTHNLRNVDVDLPRDRLVVLTGPSGSGKSSLAFDTLYAEGQRRYVESLSPYARQFMEQMQKPDVDLIEGLSPAIAIEQRPLAHNPRSTVGTVTEIHDYLRLLYARVGRPHCPKCGKPITRQTATEIVDRILALPDGTRLSILAPVVRGRKGEFTAEIDALRRAGFSRVGIDGHLLDLSEVKPLDPKRPHTIEVYVDRLALKEGLRARVADAVELALEHGQGLVKVAVLDGQDFLVSERFACVDCGVSMPEVEPRIFSFNNPHGACPACMGLGTTAAFDAQSVVPDERLSLAAGALAPWAARGEGFYARTVQALAKRFGVATDVPWQELPEAARRAILHGEDPAERKKPGRPFEGVIPALERRWQSANEAGRTELEAYRTERPCAACGGTRLRPESRWVLLGKKAITEVAALPLLEARAFFRGVALDAREREIGERVLREIAARIDFLCDVGLGYLSLDRSTGTLSGGEAQRIRLATHAGAALVGVLYVLDEPSIGLHPRDTRRLLDLLIALRDRGNSVLVVEHDRDVINAADWLVDIGPGAGPAGGRIVAQGTPAEVMANPQSITGPYLSGKRAIAVPARRRKTRGRWLTIEGATGHNLRNVTAEFPLGLFTCVTGVSGSGKSTLVVDTLHRALARRLHRASTPAAAHSALLGAEDLDRVVDIDQGPIGRTPRSNPATYVGVFSDIRQAFAKTKDSQARGYKASRYSFNLKGGRCESCQGDGVRRIEMHFLPDLYVTCDACGGKRFNPETLAIRYRGLSIADVLDLTVDEAREFFRVVPPVAGPLDVLSDVGLGYMKLGQSATQLSGGEAQRVKLARELARGEANRTLYILDEPTTGLHFADIERLLEVLQRLVDRGNTVVVIEHNLEVVKSADWVIDLGPEGGDAGGEIVAAGTPEEVARAVRSRTAPFLAPFLAPLLISPG